VNEKFEQAAGEHRTANRTKGRRPGRLLAVFKALVLLALLGVTAYGMLNSGLYSDERWLPVTAGILALLLVTVFVGNYYGDVPPMGWVFVALLAVLVATKGLSMTWTISETETIKELLRSSMYLATFLMALAALNSGRQVGPLMDVAVLIVAAVAGYGLLQKIDPLRYEITSLDGVRIDSTLDYVNTFAVVLGMGVVLALARTTRMRNAAVRGLYAALILAFLTALLLTVSRGGIGSLGVGLAVLFLLANHRLQMLANLLLVSAPAAWLFWRMQDLDGLWRAGVPDEQKVADGTTFRNYLIVALAAVFVLQFCYSLLVGRYELMPLGRRVLGAVAVGGAVLVACVGLFLVVGQYGGVSRAYDALVSNPNNTENATRRLASASIGFREDYWRVAWNEWMERPLTGTGAGTFQYTWLRERPVATGVKQVHNLYLEQGTETGVFAFLALTGFAVLLLGYTARAAWRSPQRGDRRVLLSGLVAALTVYLVSSVIEWHWYIPPSTLLFFILAAMAAKLAAKTEWNVLEEGDVRPAGGSGSGKSVVPRA
jgi:hypothetical protein